MRLPALIGLSRALDLILTGRPVRAAEALQIGIQSTTNINPVDCTPSITGLAHRVVPSGQSLDKAINLAEQLCQFPQQCLRADRNSALTHALSSKGVPRQALAQEYQDGTKVLHQESVKGARQFSDGKGRHGEFN